MNNKKLILYIEMLVLSSTAMASTTSTHAIFNWKGVYAGVFLGGASGNRMTTTEPLRVDNQTYWFRPFHNSYSYDISPSVIGGGTIGYNWQIGKTPYLISVEGEYGYLNQRGSSIDPNQTPYTALPGNNLYNNTSTNKTTIGRSYGYGLVGGRIGYVNNRALFYVKSGAIFTETESQYQSTKTDNSSSTGVAYLNMNRSNKMTGYGIGGGIEYAIPFKEFSNISVKIEYLYFGIGQTESEYGHCSCDFLWLTTESIRGIHSAKLGINYKLT